MEGIRAQTSVSGQGFCSDIYEVITADCKNSALKVLIYSIPLIGIAARISDLAEQDSNALQRICKRVYKNYTWETGLRKTINNEVKTFIREMQASEILFAVGCTITALALTIIGSPLVLVVLTLLTAYAITLLRVIKVEEDYQEILEKCEYYASVGSHLR